MIRRLLLVALVCLSAFAGVAGAGGVSFGIKGGFAVSGITETPEEWEQAKKMKPGLVLGLVMPYEWDNGFALQPELLYAEKGAGANLYEGYVDVDVTLNVNYIEIPLLAKYTFRRDSSFRPNIFAGPFFAYSLSSELKASVGIFSAGIDFSSLTHVTDWGAILGAGFAVKTKNGVVTFDARYTRGFTNVILTGDFEVNGDTETISGDDFKNHCMMFLAGFIF